MEGIQSTEAQHSRPQSNSASDTEQQPAKCETRIRSIHARLISSFIILPRLSCHQWLLHITWTPTLGHIPSTETRRLAPAGQAICRLFVPSFLYLCSWPGPLFETKGCSLTNSGVHHSYPVISRSMGKVKVSYTETSYGGQSVMMLCYPLRPMLHNNGSISSTCAWRQMPDVMSKSQMLRTGASISRHRASGRDEGKLGQSAAYQARIAAPRMAQFRLKRGKQTVVASQQSTGHGHALSLRLTPSSNRSSPTTLDQHAQDAKQSWEQSRFRQFRNEAMLEAIHLVILHRGTCNHGPGLVECLKRRAGSHSGCNHCTSRVGMR
ncbi:hypothetical protein J3F83DRAFT_241279 [Trichoderma novae-zelandiae]